MWGLISSDCIKNEIKRTYCKEMEEQLEEWKENTVFGGLYKEAKRKWGNYNKQENRQISRYLMRDLMRIRIGHMDLAKYRYERRNKGNSKMCKCGQKEETAKHIWEECKHDDI